jgi:hypothetical protein
MLDSIAEERQYFGLQDLSKDPTGSRGEIDNPESIKENEEEKV